MECTCIALLEDEQECLTTTKRCVRLAVWQRPPAGHGGKSGPPPAGRGGDTGLYPAGAWRRLKIVPFTLSGCYELVDMRNRLRTIEQHLPQGAVIAGTSISGLAYSELNHMGFCLCELERFSHDMGDAIQTSPGGSFYLNADGRSSLSCGGLHPPIPTDSIEVIDGVTLQGRFWFFQHQQAGAGRGVYVDCACRVFMTSSPFDGFLGKDFLNPRRDELKALLEAQLKPA